MTTQVDWDTARELAQEHNWFEDARDAEMGHLHDALIHVKLAQKEARVVLAHVDIGPDITRETEMRLHEYARIRQSLIREIHISELCQGGMAFWPSWKSLEEDAP